MNILVLSLQDIKATPKVFGVMSFILSGDLLHLLLVQQQQIFMKYTKGEYQTFQGSSWEDVIDRYCFSNQLSWICRYTFAEFVRIRIHQQITKIIEDVEDIDSSTWGEKCVSLYLTNHLVRKKSIRAV